MKKASVRYGADCYMDIELNKIERQIILYRYFTSPAIKGKLDSRELYGIPVSTIYKDMKDLKDAGLINIKWKPGSNGSQGEYVTVYGNRDSGKDSERISVDHNDTKPGTAMDTGARLRHLRRLKRLCIMTDKLSNDELSVDYFAGKIQRGKSCMEHYRELFPGLSDRTMERDFQTLSRIGYPIRYNRELRYYEFYEVIDEEDPWVYGVWYEKETGKLMRSAGGDYDMSKQETHMDEIMDIRKGLNKV